MKKAVLSSIRYILLIYFILFSNINGYAQSSVPEPAVHFGFVPGSDYNLFNYEQLISYFEKLDNASPMLKMVEIGNTPMGRKMYLVFISSEKNINNLEKLRHMNRELALNPDLTEKEQSDYINNGKVFFLATLSMHSTEVAPSQASPLIAYKLITSRDSAIKKYLDDVVYMMVPNQNPDGMDLEVDNYNKYRGTKYEGASLPAVYHKYIGHDNNRDYVGLTQEDTRAIARIYNLDWFPQVMVEKHQMGSVSIRYYVPPAHDPIAQNIDAGLLTWTGIFGTNMLHDLTGAGLSGVGQKTIYDDYWPGSTETSSWKNVISMLTEAASAKEASPLYIEPNELQVNGKGLAEYKKSINFPMPWPGGWWHLNDIVKLEIESTLSIIKTSALMKKEILRFRNYLCRKEVELGRTDSPFYYVVPEEQADQSELLKFIELMKEHGIQTFSLSEDYALDGISLRAGDVVYPMAQPFRAFIKEVMEKQEYPVRHYTKGGDLIRPYDITSWSLPYHRGLVSHEINRRDLTFEKKLKPLTEAYYRFTDVKKNPVIFPASANGSFKAAFMAMQEGMKVERLMKETVINNKKYGKGSFVFSNSEIPALNRIIKESFTQPAYFENGDGISLSRVNLPRIALIETYFSDMDAGWTRFLFDSYNIPFRVLHPDELEKTDLEKNYDVVVIPGSPKNLLLNGKPGDEKNPVMSNYHPEFCKGMGKKGLGKLLLFINNGGKVLSWGASTDLFAGLMEITSDSTKEEFVLPFTNESTQAGTEGLFIPGSLVRMMVKQDHPLTWGMPNEVGIFYRGSPLFNTGLPGFDMDRRVIGTFPEKNILISGYSENEEKLAGKPSMIWLRKGKGQIVLYSFHPQFRASTQATYKLLFNALLLPSAEDKIFGESNR